MRRTVARSIQSQSWSLWRSEIDRILFLNIVFNFLLVFLRIVRTGEWTYVSMIWNLFLATIPYLISKWMSLKPGIFSHRWKLTGVFVVWIFFIPNTFYIITDLFHLVPRNEGALWFDLILLMSFSWCGLIMGVLSVRHMEKAMMFHLPRRSELSFVYPLMWFNAFGVYIGRYLRYNTWDIICNPFALVYDIGTMILHPLRFGWAWAMIFFFSIMMTLMYLTIKKISKRIS